MQTHRPLRAPALQVVYCTRRNAYEGERPALAAIYSRAFVLLMQKGLPLRCKRPGVLPIKGWAYCIADGFRPTFEVPYDLLIVAVGEQPATFGVPGVEEHCYFLKASLAVLPRSLFCRQGCECRMPT